MIQGLKKTRVRNLLAIIAASWLMVAYTNCSELKSSRSGVGINSVGNSPTPTPPGGVTPTPTLPGGVTPTPTPPLPVSSKAFLNGLPAVCPVPYFVDTPANPSRKLYVSPTGSDLNLSLNPPCPAGSPCREIGSLFAVVSGTPADAVCDATVPSKIYQKYLKPGDMIVVDAGNYQPFQISQACGTKDSPITIYAASKAAQVTGNITIGAGSIWNDGIYLHHSRYLLIDGVNVQNSEKANLGMLYSSNITIRNGKFSVAGEFPVFSGFVNDLVIDHIEATGGVRQHGVYISNSPQRAVVFKNIFHDNGGAGLQVNPDESATYDHPPEFTFAPISHCMIFDSNTIYRNGSRGGAGLNLQGIRNSIIRNNLIYNNLATGLTLYHGDAAGGVGNVWLSNNVIDQAATGRNAVLIVDAADKIYFRNNIFYARKASTAAIAYASAPNHAQDLALTDSNYNFFGSAAGPVFFDNEDTGVPLTFAQWQALGKDANSFQGAIESVVTTPFTAGAPDYHLKAASILFGKGLFIETLNNEDFSGQSRKTPAKTDIGCYQQSP